jgi:hypothetical protein
MLAPQVGSRSAKIKGKKSWKLYSDYFGIISINK